MEWVSIGNLIVFNYSLRTCYVRTVQSWLLYVGFLFDSYYYAIGVRCFVFIKNKRGGKIVCCFIFHHRRDVLRSFLGFYTFIPFFPVRTISAYVWTWFLCFIIIFIILERARLTGHVLTDIQFISFHRLSINIKYGHKV